MLGGAFQVVIAISVVIIMLVIGFSIYNMEKMRAIRESGRIRKEVPIYEGVKDLSASDTFETKNPLDPSYKDLSYSVNQLGGAEYSYNFWLYIDGSDNGANLPPAYTKSELNVNEGMSDKKMVLLLRGIPKIVNYTGQCPNLAAKSDVLVKQPMIYLTNAGNALIVEMNTVNSPDGVATDTNVSCTTKARDWDTINSYKIGVKNLKDQGLTGKKWFMVTVVVQDTYPSGPIPMRNQVHVEIFINGTRMVDTYIAGKIQDVDNLQKQSILRLNNGSLHIAPVIKDANNAAASFQLTNSKKIMMADLTYFNYALDTSSIQSLFSKGFTKKYAALPTTTTARVKEDPLSRPISEEVFGENASGVQPVSGF